MERVSFSERFSHIKAVTDDNSESDTDFSDNDLIKKVPRTKSVTRNLTQNLERNGKNNSEEDMLMMKPEWMPLFQIILEKSRNLSGIHREEKDLCGEVKQLNNSLPCFENTLNNLNQEFISTVGDDLITRDLTVERHETELGLCADKESDIDSEINYETITKKATQACSVNRNLSGSDDYSHDERDNNGLIINCSEAEVYIDEPDFTKLSSDVVLYQECLNEKKNSVPIQTLKRSQVVESVRTKESVQLNSSDENKVVNNTYMVHEHDDTTKFSQKSDKVSNEQSGRVSKEQSDIISKEQSYQVNKEQSDKVNIEQSDKIRETYKSATQKSKPIDRTKDLSAKSCNKSVYKENIDKNNVYKENIDKNSSVFRENKVERSCTKKFPKNCNNAKDCTDLIVSQLKDTSKVKTFEIKPALSFPLDELLPLSPTKPIKKRKTIDNMPTTTTETTSERKRLISNFSKEQNCDVVSEDVDFTCVQPSIYNESNIFHGTLYESSPEKIIPEEELEEYDKNSGQSVTQTFPFDISIANLVAVLQNVDQPVIESLQAALHEQIGSNLEALAFRARQRYSASPTESENQAPSLGFYMERKEKGNTVPNAGGDNATSEKYDELLDLLVEQCSALVKTDDDRCKLSSVLKVLKKEGEMKFTCSSFTPPHLKIERKFTCNDVNQAEGDFHHGYMKESSTTSSETNQHVELFEGRTLLKGGVKPRHIPKTIVHKPEQDDPKDPREPLNAQKSRSVVKLQLPEFAEEIYGEKRVKQILHLDWNKHGNQPVTVCEKDPQVRCVPDMDSNLKLIVDATKTLIETFQSSHENMASKTNNFQENSIGKSDEIPFLKNKQYSHQETPKSTKVKDKDVEMQSRPVQVRIRDSTQAAHRNSTITNTRHSALQSIDSFKFSYQDKETCIGNVKPLKELKETKPSIGIVRPIQVKKSDTEVDFKKDVNILPLGATRQSVSREQAIDMEDRETQTTKGVQWGVQSNAMGKKKINTENTVSADDKLNKSITDKKSGDQESKRKKYFREKVTISSEMIILSSDFSGSEEGQIDTDSEPASIGKVSAFKKRSSVDGGDKERSSRSYRKRDRSSSVSSIDSRHSFNLKGERRSYISESARSYSSESVRQDRSQSRDQSRFRSSSKGSNTSHHYRSRRRHHTTRDDRFYRDSDHYGVEKRHHYYSDATRKRHRTESGRTSTYSGKILMFFKFFYLCLLYVK